MLSKLGMIPTAHRVLSKSFDISTMREDPFISNQYPSSIILTLGSSTLQSTKEIPCYSLVLMPFKNFLKKGFAILAGTIVNSEDDERMALKVSSLYSFMSPS